MYSDAEHAIDLTNNRVLAYFFAYLVCHRDKDTKQKEITTPIIRFRYDRNIVVLKVVKQISETRNYHHKVIAVCLDEIVSCNSCWINVMLSEWPNKSLANNKQFN